MADVRSQLEGRVSSNHANAQTAIWALRGIAVTVKRLGDENLRLHDQLTTARSERDDALDKLALVDGEMIDQSRQLDQWSDLLEDFKRGVRDRDEVLAGTVGA